MTHFPIILSAPSGGGKTTIARALLKARTDIGYSVSCTTRQPRGGEVHGKDYYFLSRADFLTKRQRGEFAESAEVHGNLYGTLRSEVLKVLESGKHVLMDIDVQGAVQFTRVFPQSVTIFILPPTAEVLLERLRGRQTESAQQLADRLQSALQELQSVDEYEYVVVNDDLDLAIKRITSIIEAEVSSRERVVGLRTQVALLIDQLEREIQSHNNSEGIRK
ncbi:MAG TPA: guanylate kinase [Gemmatimonadaceae bacterium]|nr:guanylate kinase [Gemmatimonadaceae bacterium]